MTARARTTRPRARRASKRRGFALHWPRDWKRHGATGAAIAAVCIVASAFLVDFGAVTAGGRDWLMETFGAGLAILAILSALGGRAVSRRLYLRRGVFVRQASGVLALALFAWGGLGLNHVNWTAGGVQFSEVTLGGRIGHAIVSGPMGLVAWASLFVLGMALAAPRPTRWFARNAPEGVRYAWQRRWPHQAAGAVGRFFLAIGKGAVSLVAFAFHRPGDDAEDDGPVIGGTLRDRLDISPAASHEAEPRVFRPSIDPSSPTSAMGAGAAAHFSASSVTVLEREPVAFEAPAAEFANEPDEEPELPDEPETFADAADDGEEEQPEQLAFILGRPGGWALPDIGMLHAPQISPSRRHDNAARAQLIVDTLASFGVDASVVEVNEGPTVTQFGVEPGWEVRYKELQLKDEQGKTRVGPGGRAQTERVEVSRTRVRVNKITALQNDLALALAAPSLRIEAPVPGRAIVGIEVPNDSATVVTLRHVMETKEFTDLERKSKLAIALGKGVSGTPVVADLARMPHLLIAGATGSGKSVCINAIIAGIMMNATPDQVRFVMVDPKRVELTAYGNIPHLAFSEVIVDMDKVVGTLQAVVSEMEARYKKFEQVGVRNLEAYNRHPRVMKKLPFWVVIIDELADLMMVAPFEVEKLLCRLAQLARATGIHLVVATQRPSVDVVTGLIKANFPTRIAFAVTSQTDSRTILDMGGAEKLLGRGDMRYMPTDVAKPIRIQGVYVSDAEVERLVEFWTDERFSELAPETADDLLEKALVELNGGEDIEIDEDEPIVKRARELAMEHQRVSPSLFQRRLRIGYVKAARLIDLLADEGIIGPREEGESRTVLVRAGDGFD